MFHILIVSYNNCFIIKEGVEKKIDIIDEFWIFTFDGIPLFTYSPKQKENDIIISGFLSAVQKFCYQMNPDEHRFINSLTLGEYLFNFLIDHKYQLFFVSKSSDEVSPKKINKYLKDIQEGFTNQFDEAIQNFEGEISVFEKFKPEFQKIYDGGLFQKLKRLL
ncbi:MAG: hypothetical protein BAJALOKI1v1_660008 [Promethearchaeota archaeon]|nr:MAG: hypothetical protein BAJALOKI1v1_660008 [Candidatus Lokiarchaeota archaeon]